MVGLQDGCVLSVVAYPVAWRVEVVNDDKHRGFEYVRSEQIVTCSTRTTHRYGALAFTGEPRR